MSQWMMAMRVYRRPLRRVVASEFKSLRMGLRVQLSAFLFLPQPALPRPRLLPLLLVMTL